MAIEQAILLGLAGVAAALLALDRTDQPLPSHARLVDPAERLFWRIDRVARPVGRWFAVLAIVFFVVQVAAR